MYWKYADIFKEMKGMSPDALTSNLPRMLEQLFGQCRLPLDHRGTVSIAPDDPTVEYPPWTPGDGTISTEEGCGTQTVAQYFGSDTLGGGSGPPASLFVGSPGIAGNQSIDNSGAGPPTVTGGMSTYFCGNNYSETQIVQHLYVDQIFFRGGDTITSDDFVYWTATGDEGDNQKIENQEECNFRGEEDGPIEVECKANRVVEIQDNGKIKLSSNDDDWDYFQDKIPDGDVADMVDGQDLVIKVEVKVDGGDEEIRWYIDASAIAGYTGGTAQVLGHHTDATWKWYTIVECS